MNILDNIKSLLFCVLIPVFEIHFFPRRISLRRRDEAPPDAITAGGLEGGRKTPREILQFTTRKDAFLKPFPPFFM